MLLRLHACSFQLGQLFSVAGLVRASPPTMLPEPPPSLTSLIKADISQASEAFNHIISLQVTNIAQATANK